MKTTIFSLEDIRTIVAHVGLDRIMDDAIATLYEALEQYDTDKYAIPVREGFYYEDPELGLIEWMPALAYGGSVAIKVVGYHPANPKRLNIPTIMSTVLSFDTHNGHLVSVMDGNLLTAVRTGAASAVASRVLAHPDATTLGLIGCGAQAISQVHALSRVFAIRRLLIHDSDPRAMQSFPKRLACLGLTDVDIISTRPEELVAGVEMLCTQTSVAVGGGPVFADEAIANNIHINALGSDFPGKMELPLSLLQRSLVCPDFRPQALREGECQQVPEEHLGPDLVGLVQQREKYSVFRDQSTVFDSTGWALEDYITVGLFTRYGLDLGCGTELTLGNVAADPLNPYASLSVLRDVAKGAV